MGEGGGGLHISKLCLLGGVSNQGRVYSRGAFIQGFTIFNNIYDTHQFWVNLNHFFCNTGMRRLPGRIRKYILKDTLLSHQSSSQTFTHSREGDKL